MMDDTVRIGADTSELRKELSKIPGMTEASIGKAATAASKEWGKVEAAATKAAKGSSAAMFDLGKSLNQLTPALGVASAGLAGIGASAAALYEVTSAIVDATRRMDELVASTQGLQSLGPPIDQDSIAAAARMNENLDALSVVTDKVAALYAEKYAPALEVVSGKALEMALATADLVQSMSDASTKAAALVAAYTPLDEALTAVLGTTTRYTEAAAELRAELNEQQEAAARLLTIEEQRAMLGEHGADVFARWAKEADEANRKAVAGANARKAAEERAALAAEDAAERAAEAQKRATADADKARQAEWDRIAEGEALKMQLIGEMATATTETQKSELEIRKEAHRAAIDAMVADWQRIGDATSAYTSALSSLGGSFETLAEAQAEKHASRLDEIRTEAAALKAGLDERTEAEQAAAMSRLAFLAEEREEVQKQHAASVKASKIAGIAQATIDAAAAAIALIPSFAYLGPGAPVAAAGVAGAALAAQLAAMNKFHTGTLDARGGGTDPSEFAALLRRGEGVANNAAMASPDFRQRLAEANAGKPSSSGPVEAAVYLNDRMLTTLDKRTARVTGRDRQRSGKRLGMRTHYDR